MNRFLSSSLRVVLFAIFAVTASLQIPLPEEPKKEAPKVEEPKPRNV